MKRFRKSLWQIIVQILVLLLLQPVNMRASAYSGFINDAIVPAQASQTETGVPASITIAQAILESSWGDEHIGNANNYFGIKCQTGTNGVLSYGTIATGCVLADTTEWSTATSTYVPTKAYFRTYANMTDSFRDHGHFFLDNPRYAAAMKHTNDPKQFAVEIQKAGYATSPTYASSLIRLMDQYDLYQYDKGTALLSPNQTSTVLVFDTSGSMSDADPSGIVKLEAAKAAASNVLDVIAAENQASISGGHQAGIVDFNDSTNVDAKLTSDISTVKSAIQSLYANGGTGMPLGLQTALDMFGGDTGGKPIIILLTDGMPNIGLNGETDEATVRQQVLDLATQAGQKGICIYTVGLGDPTLGNNSDYGLDEDFLKQVASDSKCGTYQNAKNAWQLANIYIGLRHTSTGNTLLQKSGQINQGQNVEIGNVQVPHDQSMMLFTLNWPGSRLAPILTDPNGRKVDSNYPGASFSATNTLASIIIQNPQTGQWDVAVQGVDVPEGTTNYNAVLSVRPNLNPPAAPSQLPNSSAFPVVILILVLAGGGVGVYVLSRTIKKRQPVGGMVYIGGNAQLRGLNGGITGQSFTLMDGLVIGRGANCNLHLNDPTVSRQHARLRYASGRWYLQDMNGSSGTYVNGARVNATALNNGDRIRIGSNEFEFRE